MYVTVGMDVVGEEELVERGRNAVGGKARFESREQRLKGR